MLRSANPTGSTTSTRGVYFEPSKREWVAGKASSEIWLTPGSNTLWVKNTTDTEIWSYEDTLLVGPALLAPANGSSTGRTDTVTLTWEALDGANKYFVWIAEDLGFVTGFKGTGMASNSYSSTTTKTVSGLEDGKQYYWKICSADTQEVTGRGLSPWSEIWSFTTGMGGAEWNPFMTSAMYPGNVAPIPGAQGTVLKPGFQWEAADWAVSYAFVLADNPDFVSPLVNKTGANALKTTAYACEVELTYSTTYYWKVAAIGTNTQSLWGVGIFTTMAEPVAPTPPVVVAPPTPPVTLPAPTPAPAPITPAFIWVIIAIGAILVIALIILIVRTRRVV
jgi:hypothetical protein